MHSRSSCGTHECVAEKLCSSSAKNAALVAVDPQLERLLDKLDRVFLHAFPCSPRPHIDVAVVGVSAEPQTSPFEVLVKFVLDDQRQDGTERRALRRSFLAHGHKAVGHDARAEISADEPQERSVSAVAFQDRHQPIMVDRIEELGELHLHDPQASLRNVALSLLYGLIRVPALTEAVAYFQKKM